MNSDEKIWKDFKKGDKYALSHIYNQHIQLLYRYGKKFSNDDELIKDSIQDLFFDLIRTRKNLGDTDNIKFYLLTSFRRKLIQNLKKKPLFSEIEIEKEIEAKIVYAVEQELFEKEELSHKQKIVREGLGKLTAKQREILFYRFTCDFGYEQICEIMSLKYDSARKQHFRALKALKQFCQISDTIKK